MEKKATTSGREVVVPRLQGLLEVQIVVHEILQGQTTY
jgi:hypothetical protein